MTTRRVCLDYHIVIEVDVPDGMEDDAVADIAYDKVMGMSDGDIVGELQYDGYLVDYR